MKKLLTILTALALILSLCTCVGFASEEKTDDSEAPVKSDASISADAEELRDFITKCTELISCSEKTKKTLFEKACKMYAQDDYDAVKFAKARLKYKLVLDDSSSLNIFCSSCNFANTVIPVFEGDETLENMYCLCENCGHKFKYLEYCTDCYTEDVMKPICCNDPLKSDESKSYTFALCTSCGALRRMMDCEHDCGDSCEYEQHDYEEVIAESARAIMDKRKREILSYLMIFDLSDETRDYLFNQ